MRVSWASRESCWGARTTKSARIDGACHGQSAREHGAARPRSFLDRGFPAGVRAPLSRRQSPAGAARARERRAAWPRGHRLVSRADGRLGAALDARLGPRDPRRDAARAAGAGAILVVVVAAGAWGLRTGT